MAAIAGRFAGAELLQLERQNDTESVMMMGTEAMKVALALAARCCWWRWSRALSSVFCRPPRDQRNDAVVYSKNHRRIYCHYIAGPWMLNLLLDYVRTLFTTCRISSGSPYNDAGDKRSMASWLSLYFWPLLRVLALISTAQF